MSFAQPATGELVGGRYRIVRELGRGAMGVVFEAVHEGLGRKCALKLLRPAQSSDEDAVRRFEREARILAKLDSPHLVEVLDVARTELGVPYLVMELLEGESLEARLARGELPPEEALAIVRDVALGAHAAHVAGVVHRDLKLSNVVLTASGAKVVDFGVASFFDGSMDGSTASVAGTPRTMSPEQLLGERVGPASDVWAIGVVTYRLFAGKYPFEAESMAAQMLAIMKGFVPLDRTSAGARGAGDVDREALLVRVARAVDAALVSDPMQRTASALAFARALEAPAVDAVAPSERPPREEKIADSASSVALGEGRAPLPAAEARPSRALGPGAQAVLAALGILVLFAGGMRLHERFFRSLPPPSVTTRDTTAPSSPALPSSPVASASSSPPVLAASAPSVQPEPRPVSETSKSAHGPSPVPSARVSPKASAAPSGDGLPIHL